MKSFKTLKIIGTSHIAIESINEVKRVIETEKPEIIALELDLQRFKKLISKKRQEIKFKDVFFQGSVLNSLGALIEKKLGEKVGIMPGEEMLTAISLAKKGNIQIALIDQPIQITFSKLSSRITWKEKFRFVSDLFLSLILPKKRIKIDLTKVPEEDLVKKIINEVKKKYPSVYKTLIYERNIFMAEQLINLLKLNKRIIAIVGAGHEEEILRIIKCNFQKQK